jgi:hypothetical protein
MPIRADRRGLYPPPAEWREIRRAILERAGNRCEGSPRYPGCRVQNGQIHPRTGSRVVLTIAHLDHNPLNNSDSNLSALCQACHLGHDAQQHAESRRLRRFERLGDGPNEALPLEEPDRATTNQTDKGAMIDRETVIPHCPQCGALLDEPCPCCDHPAAWCETHGCALCSSYPLMTLPDIVLGEEEPTTPTTNRPTEG